MMYQSISVSYPKSHGNGPKRLSDVVKRPSGPNKRVVSFKQVVKNSKGNTTYAKR